MAAAAPAGAAGLGARVLGALVRCACVGSEAIQAALARHGAQARDPSAEFETPQPQPGDVVAVTPPLFVTCIRSNNAGTSHAPGVAAASMAARARGTYAVGGGGEYLPADASDSELRNMLARVSGSDALWEALAAGYSGRILPALSRRLAETEARLQEYAQKEGYILDPIRLAHRALAVLDTEMLVDSLRYGATVPITDAAWRRAVAHQHHQAAGVAPVKSRPMAWDWRGLTEQLGYQGKPRTRATSHWPYPPRPRPEGSIPTLDVRGILDELERLDGPVSENDPHVWLALDNLYAEEIYPKDTLAPLMEGARARGTALVLGPATKPHVASIHDEAFEKEVIPARVAMGVLKPVEAEEAMRPGNVVSALTCAAKGEMSKSPAERAVIAARDLAGMGAAAMTRAVKMVEATRAGIAAGAEPADAAAAAHAAEMSAPKLRMCHSGHDLSQHLHVGSFAMPTSTHILETAAPDTHMYCADMANWYFATMVGLAALFAHYVTWKGRYWLQLRMSMGLSPSAVVASIASAFIVYFALRYGARAVVNYIDDLIGSARGREAAERDQALLHRAANVVAPGGVAEQKTRHPAPVQVALGLEYNFPEGKLSVSHDKLFSYAVHLFYVEACLGSACPKLRAAITTPSLVALTGKLGFLCTQVPRGKVFMRTLYAHSAAKQAPAGYFRLQILHDLQWWKERMLAGSLPVTHFFAGEGPPGLVHVCGGGSVDPAGGPHRLAPEGPPAMEGGARVPVVRSDAGDEGAAAIHEGKVVYRQWTRQERGFSSDVREILIVKDIAKLLGRRWRGKRVVFVLDHSGNCDNIISGSCKASLVVRDVIDWLYLDAEQQGYTFVAMWAPRESNSAADRLSKCSDAGKAAQVCLELGLSLC